MISYLRPFIEGLIFMKAAVKSRYCPLLMIVATSLSIAFTNILNMKQKSTLQNSLTWKSWHGGNHMFGDICFVFGSFALFPFLSQYINTAAVSAWFYTIGSLNNFAAEVTEWLFFTQAGCPYLQISINFFISVIGSIMYLIGSIIFLPMFGKVDQGNLLFIIGSACIFLSQIWKLARTFSEQGKSARECYEQDVCSVYMDVFSGLGGLMYLVGTFVLVQAIQDMDFTIPGVIIYCFGGIFFTVSGYFLNYRYFRGTNANNNTKASHQHHNWY